MNECNEPCHAKMIKNSVRGIMFTVYLLFCQNSHAHFKTFHNNANECTWMNSCKKCLSDSYSYNGYHLSNTSLLLVSLLFTYSGTCVNKMPRVITCRAPRSKKWNFRTQFLENFRTTSGHFCRFCEAQETENARFSVLINVIIIRTKANRHFYKHI